MTLSGRFVNGVNPTLWPESATELGGEVDRRGEVSRASEQYVSCPVDTAAWSLLQVDGKHAATLAGYQDISDGRPQGPRLRLELLSSLAAGEPAADGNMARDSAVRLPVAMVVAGQRIGGLDELAFGGSGLLLVEDGGQGRGD